MKLDTGLQEGIAALRDDDHLLDLTLKVDGQEFRVHKVVLASVSDYFCAMLCGSLLESRSDVIELKGIRAEQVSVLLDFIYTGDDDVIASNPKEMLECGLYFQVPKVIKECEQRLIASLCVENCLDLLSTFQRFPLGDTAQMIMVFIKTNMKKVVNHYPPSKMTLEVLQMALKNWKNSEWELFNYLTLWIAVDFEGRKEFTSYLMRQVRFKLMTPEEICAVKETSIYKNPSNLWKGLVDAAAVYLGLPIHQKVLDKSKQNSVRFSKSLFLMDTNQDQPLTYVSSKDKTGKNCWKQYPPAKPPQGTRKFQAVIEVNNFLITCSTSNRFENQRWQIYDPRTSTWHDMTTMLRPRELFPTVHFNNCLYVLGGKSLKFVQSKRSWDFLETIEQYSFATGTWISNKKLPVSVMCQSACMMKDKLYVSGGMVEGKYIRKCLARMDCLDLSTQNWESKAPMLTAYAGHKMCVMKIKRKDAIVMISRDQKMDYYDAETDQWSHCNFSVSHTQPFIHKGSPVDCSSMCVCGPHVVQGNTLYLTNVSLDGWYHFVSLKWKIPEEEDRFDIVEVRLADVPFRNPYVKWENIMGSMLAFPAQSATKDI